MTQKKYGVIIADPPWAFRNSGITGAAQNHYPTMSTDEICRMPIEGLAATESLLLMWTTWATMPDALSIISKWGFEYKTGFPWLKVQGEPQRNLWGEFEYRPVYGMGWWIRGCSEPILIATRGELAPPTDYFLGILSRRFRHSRKPENIYQYAEIFPGPYLELFARRTRLGWDVWGNEVEGVAL